MKVLGLSAFYHDSAAALIEDGLIIAAAQEERFTREKHDSSFPHEAIKYCLKEANVSLDEVDYIVFYDKPFLKFERLIETYLAFAPKGFSSFKKALPVWLKEKLFLKHILVKELNLHVQSKGEFNFEQKLLFSEHHLSHAASAFYPSPFHEAAVLTMDGVGEWATTSFGIGREHKLDIHKEIHFPHSLGLLYSAFTYYTGFKVNSGEYKVMGLAPYGDPKFAQLIRDHLIDIKPDGSFRLDMSYFNYCVGLTMTSPKFHKLFGGPPRQSESELTQKEMDLAASIQVVCEEVVIKMARSLAKETGLKNLCLAGGVALNCVANGKVLRDGAFEKIWIQPAAGDAGGALGAAFVGYHLYKNQPRIETGRDMMKGSYLGPSFAQSEIESRLNAVNARFEVMDDAQLISATAKALSDEKAIGWFQGRMEFGPRALGGRSIIADARSPRMQSLLNLKVKYRESFRPFAPSVLRSDVAHWFELEEESPYMLLVADVVQKRRVAMSKEENSLFGIQKLNVPRSDIPAVTHIDYSARVQTVSEETNKRYHQLISEFKKLTGCPVLVNTSFNVRGEPIVGSPEDAFRCFMGTELDVLVLGNCYLVKDQQDPALKQNYEQKFSLD